MPCNNPDLILKSKFKAERALSLKPTSAALLTRKD